MTSYKYTGPVDCTVQPDLSKVKGKSAIVTGGSTGIGKGYVEALVKAGAYVTIGDINEKDGAAVVEAAHGNAQFVKCDVRSWDDQLNLFKTALANAPSKCVDIVIANAGISGVDVMFKTEDPDKDPEKPELRILDINLYGVMYTTRLAWHYFQRTPLNDEHDRCLIVQASLAGYLELSGAVQYQVSKFGGRAIMYCSRSHPYLEGYRVNTVCPWFVETPILDEKAVAHLKATGITFATVEDCVQAMLRIVTDKGVTGRSFAILPRDHTKEGYRDIDFDDYKEGHFLLELTENLRSRIGHRVAQSKREWNKE